MAAHSDNFPWVSYYGHYDFFEREMKRHSKVVALSRQMNGVYNLERLHGDILRVFICECYAFGVAEFIETTQHLSGINAIIINSSWCGYSLDAKRHCRDSNVGLFKINEFMSALHNENFWLYLTDSEKKFFKSNGWI